MQDQHSRFVVACATGPLSEDLIEQAVTTTVERTQHRPLCWFSDGWHGYGSILERAYRKPVLPGKRGRPRLLVPESLSLTQTVKHRDEHGRLLSVEIRATLGARMGQAGTVHVERLNEALRDRLGALTRKRTPKPSAIAPSMRWWACSSSITISIGLIRPCGSQLPMAGIAISSGLRPWLWG